MKSQRGESARPFPPQIYALCLLFAALLLMLLVSACASAAPTPFPTSIVPTLAPTPTLNPAGDAGHGRVLFSQWRCTNCHGESGQGGIGPTLARTTLSFASFNSAVRQTRPPKPAFSEAELSNQDVLDIYTWLSTLDPLTVALASTPISMQLAEGEVAGMTLYTEFGCDQCHGAFAQGGVNAPPLVSYMADVETFLNVMGETTPSIPEHDLAALDVGWLRRLYNWLRAGANPGDGC
jgi:mono/diheme cytochrome c family protein